MVRAEENVLNETIQSVNKDILNKSICSDGRKSRGSALSGHCESCGRDDESEKVTDSCLARPFPATAKKVDNFLSNGYNSGLWHLSVSVVGLIGIYGLVILLIKTTNYLRKTMTEPA